MDKKKLAKQKEVLEGLLKHLTRDLEKVKSESPSRYEAKFPEYGNDPELTDQEIEEYNENLAIATSTLARINNIKSAFEKIEAGNYENCGNCKNPIGKERLLAVPEALYCVKCQDIKER